jgi:hypothetical protein
VLMFPRTAGRNEGHGGMRFVAMNEQQQRCDWRYGRCWLAA